MPDSCGVSKATGACRLITGSVQGSAIAQGSVNLLMVTWVWVIAG
jgi:hypothetical protein